MSTHNCSSSVSYSPGINPPTDLVPVPVGVTVSSHVVHQHCGLSPQSVPPPYEYDEPYEELYEELYE